MSTASENVSSISLSIATLIASLSGLTFTKVGSSISSEVKFNDVLSSIPEKELLEGSSKAVESIST